MLDLRTDKQDCLLSVRVQPQARRTAVTGIHDQSLKIALNAPAVEGRANKALIGFLADLVHVARNKVTIERGELSREKQVRIQGITSEEFLRLLSEQGVELQDQG